MEIDVARNMSKKERAILVAVLIGAAFAAFYGFAYAGVGGALLGAGCIGGFVVFLDRYWMFAFLMVYIFLMLYFWNVGI